MEKIEEREREKESEREGAREKDASVTGGCRKWMD